MNDSICFRVVKEPYGWAVRMGEGMMTPFTTRLGAVEHANCCADALRRCGEAVVVVVEEVLDAPTAPRFSSRSFSPRSERRIP